MFKWLHISDLHVGIGTQEWLWPTLKHSFYDDMKSLHEDVGPWNLVIFSGDFVQKGSPEEFEQLNTVLVDLWKKFNDWNFCPKLFVLPGNHDLSRVIPLSPELRSLRRWWDEEDLHDQFFSSGAKSVYRDAATALFENYQKWVANCPVDIIEGKKGLLPGDQACTLNDGGLSIGIVGLNSTWLQIDDSDYLGQLHVDPRQLLLVTENDPTSWCGKNSFNILVTHHPLEWLQTDSQNHWRSDINPAGRFDLHLFGHMHEPSTTTMSLGGSAFSNSIQAASLFGLRFTHERKERIHGYSIVELGSENSVQRLRVWPRKLRTLASGERKLGPDLSFDLGKDSSFFMPLNQSKLAGISRDDHIDATTASSATGAKNTINLRAIDDSSRQILKKIEFDLPNNSAHLNVRNGLHPVLLTPA